MVLNTLKFVLSAVWYGHAYIDMDGCLLHRFRCPPGSYGEFALQWWMDNLRPTPIVYPRLVLLYVLRALGVRLHIWTNRSPQHKPVTRTALGRHVWLFDTQVYGAGQKAGAVLLLGPVMDDQPKYVRYGKRWGLLVEER